MPRWLGYLVGGIATVLCFAVLWEVFSPSGEYSGVTTLIITSASAFVGVLVMLTLRDEM